MKIIKYIFMFVVFTIVLDTDIGCSKTDKNSSYYNKWIQFSTDAHTIALKSDGTIWGWGLNDFYQLGLGHPYGVSVPTKIGTDTDWVMVECGGSYTMAIKSNGTLWSWGYNEFGQLGLGDSGEKNNRKIPQQVGHDTDWVSISTGGHNIARKKNGTLWAWGANHFGQLGFGDTKDRNVPTQIGTDTDWSYVDTELYTMALKTNGTLWAWGWRSELGLSDSNTERNIPTQIGNSSDWVTVSCNSQSMAIKKDGTLWGWGINSSGELELGDTKDRNVPTQIGMDKDWLMVATSAGHTIALKTDGTIWAWGDNVAGQLGIGDKEVGHPKTTPCQIGTDNNWKSIAAAGVSSLAMKTDGTLWGWGSNQRGVLGLGYKEGATIPTQIK